MSKRSTAMVVGLAMWLSLAAKAQNASGTLNTTLIHRSGILLVFNSDPAGVALGNSGTSAASLNFGSVSAYGAIATAGVTRSATATDFTVSSPFDIFVEVGGITTTSYRLSAALQSAPGVYTFKVDAVTLATAAQTIVAADPNYGRNVLHTLSLTVPQTAPAGGVSNVVNFTVTPN